MRIQEQREKSAVCRFAGQLTCRCGQGCAKTGGGTAASNLYAAEFMLYAFHFAKELEAPGKIIGKNLSVHS